MQTPPPNVPNGGIGIQGILVLFLDIRRKLRRFCLFLRGSLSQPPPLSTCCCSLRTCSERMDSYNKASSSCPLGTMNKIFVVDDKREGQSEKHKHCFSAALDEVTEGADSRDVNGGWGGGGGAERTERAKQITCVKTSDPRVQP